MNRAAFIFGGGWGLYLLTYVAGFASDIEERTQLRPALTTG